MIPTSAVDRQLLAKLLSVQYTVFRGKCRKPVPEIGKTTYVHKNVPEYPHPEFEDNEFLPRRLSYWPPDLPQLQKPNPRKPWWKVKEMITLYPPPPEEPEYTESPNYPPISNFFRVNSRPLQERAKRLEWYDKIKALPTPDQKMYEIVEVRDHACVLMQAWSHLYDNLPLYQHLTKTNLIRGSLPSSYDNMDVSSVKEELKHHILDTVRMHAIDAKRKRPGRIQRPDIVPKEMRPDHLPVENLIEEITAICMKSLGNEHPHLLDAQVDYLPDIRSWWTVGDLQTPSNHPKYNTTRKDKAVDQIIQYRDVHALHIRTRNPLSPGMPNLTRNVRDVPSASELPGAADSWNKLHPVRVGYKLRWNWLAMVPGYLPQADNSDFPFLNFYSRQALKLREKVTGEEYPDVADTVDAMGIMSSFAWLNSLALHHGFTPYQDLTYPLTSQTIVTDGQTWNFMVYQMNTHSFHRDLGENNTKNLCWSTGEMKLYDHFSDGTFHGLDETVLDNIIKFFVRQPELNAEEDMSLRPYLGVDTSTEETRAVIRRRLRRRVGQFKTLRERWHRERARISPWERVYGDLNKEAVPARHWRKPPRFAHLLKTDFTKFSI